MALFTKERGGAPKVKRKVSPALTKRRNARAKERASYAWLFGQSPKVQKRITDTMRGK